MQIAPLHASLKALSVVVLVLMAVAIGYAGFIAFIDWHGISV